MAEDGHEKGSVRMQRFRVVSDQLFKKPLMLFNILNSDFSASFMWHDLIGGGQDAVKVNATGPSLPRSICVKYLFLIPIP